jgi:hypothetical protein
VAKYHNVKAKVVPFHVRQTLRQRRCIALNVFDPDARRGCVVKFRLGPFYRREETDAHRTGSWGASRPNEIRPENLASMAFEPQTAHLSKSRYTDYVMPAAKYEVQKSI